MHTYLREVLLPKTTRPFFHLVLSWCLDEGVDDQGMPMVSALCAIEVALKKVGQRWEVKVRKSRQVNYVTANGNQFTIFHTKQRYLITSLGLIGHK